MAPFDSTLRAARLRESHLRDNRGMPVSADALRSHLDYTAWASHRIVDAAAKLSPEELSHDFQTADRTILNTLVHTYVADRLWLARMQHEPQRPPTDADRSLQVLETEWPALMEHWNAWAASLTDESAQAPLEYHDLRGNPWKQPVWQLILHVVNHGTHHRGQASGFLRTLGHTPPVLDLVGYYREKGL